MNMRWSSLPLTQHNLIKQFNFINKAHSCRKRGLWFVVRHHTSVTPPPRSFSCTVPAVHENEWWTWICAQRHNEERSDSGTRISWTRHQGQLQNGKVERSGTMSSCDSSVGRSNPLRNTGPLQMLVFRHIPLSDQPFVTDSEKRNTSHATAAVREDFFF